jgi:hypothetical protein
MSRLLIVEPAGQHSRKLVHPNYSRIFGSDVEKPLITSPKLDGHCEGAKMSPQVPQARPAECGCSTKAWRAVVSGLVRLIGNTRGRDLRVYAISCRQRWVVGSVRMLACAASGVWGGVGDDQAGQD